MAKKTSRTPRVGVYDSRGNEGDQDQESGPVRNRYGLSESEWFALTPEERVIHYNRQNICEHVADINAWPKDLRESYSFDPYFHTAHMMPCKRPTLSIDECECQMCVGKIGIERKGDERKVNVEAVREKWRKRFAELK